MGLICADELETYFGADEESDVCDWMASQEEKSRRVLSSAVTAQLRAKLTRAQQRLAYWQAERRAERFPEFWPHFDGLIACQQTTVDKLRAELDQRIKSKSEAA